jgi:transcriptional regulator with XRE-family HTH domain
LGGGMLKDKLRELRGKRSLEVVADFIGKSQSGYWNYEQGQPVDSDTLLLLCEFFGVSPNEILEWEK